MGRIWVLDTGPAGRIAHPSVSPKVLTWLIGLTDAGDEIALAEIVDYELRRNFLLEIRRGRAVTERSLQRLDALRTEMVFLPIDSSVMTKAAELWAEARKRGKPMADPKEIDGDAILAAQALQVGGIVVTENPGHLGLFVPVELWDPTLT
jgi:predicted nucleic acid-binding protein